MFLGTPEVAVVPLLALHGAGFEIVRVVTRADKRRGRGSGLRPSPVKAAALELGIPVSHNVDDVLGSGADLGVVVAFGQVIRPHVLAELPMVNVHFSLLPRWRGAAPVERAILAGDVRTGVCVMQVDEGLDTGGVFASSELAIGDDTTAEQLRHQLVAVGTELLVELLTAGSGVPVEQSGEATYAAKIEPHERVLDFANPAAIEHRRVRIGGASTSWRGRRLAVHAARLRSTAPLAPGQLGEDGLVGCGEGALQLLTVQPEGRATMEWADFANGYRPRDGERLGSW